MRPGPTIRNLLAAILLGAAGCATPAGPLEQTELSQARLDEFLAAGRDARRSFITIYPAPTGARFADANRLHQDQIAELDFVSPKTLAVPVVKAQTATGAEFHLLLDSTARQNWLLMASVNALEYRPFAPPLGEYADHVEAEIPGYAGAGNKIVLDTLHVENPVFFVAPARGGFGPLARVGDPATAGKERRELGARTHAVLGAALMREFAFIRIDYPGRAVRFSTHAPYRPAEDCRVLAELKLLDWHGRPAVQGRLDGRPLTLVIDTAGEFELALPGDVAADATGTLVLGDLETAGVRLTSHAAQGLPEEFHARLGRRFLSRFALALDHRRARVWLEEKTLPGAAESATTPADAPPVRYRGITR